MYIAIDVGGTSVNIGSFESLDPNSQIGFEKLPTLNNYEEDLKQITSTIQNLSQGKTINALGIGMPGTLNSTENIILDAENVRDWQNKEITKDISQSLNIQEIYACHDVKAAAISEAIFNNPSNKDFALIIWGTGIGATYVRYINNEVVFQQVELGYQTIEKKTVIKGVEYPGYLEFYCGGRKMAERYDKPVSELSEDEWAEVLNNFSYGLSNLLALNHISRIVFSGGVGTKQASRLGKLNELTKQKMDFLPVPDFEVAKFGENAGLIGALGLIQLKRSSL
jgi:glucokinase